MLNSHPTIEDFEGFLRGSTASGGAARNARVMRHLLAQCASCRELLNAMGWTEGRLERLLQITGAISLERIFAPYDYGQAFAKAERTLLAFFAPDEPTMESPDALIGVLETLDRADQFSAVGDRQFANPHTVRALIERSHSARYTNAERMLHFAHLARLAADNCTAESTGSAERLADLRARAWGHFGNSLRVSGRLPEADETLATARRYQERGTGDPYLRARLCEQTASLRIFQGRLAETIAINEEAEEIYTQLDELHLLAGALLRKATALVYAGDPENAVAVLHRAMPLIDHEEDPHLLLAASHNLIHCYINLDRPDQALALYSEARDLYQEFNDDLILLRAGWQEGQLLRDLGHLTAAESALLRVQQGFLAKGLGFEAALVSLDLSTIYVRLGLTEELRRTVVEAIPIFRALGVSREALAALIQLQHVAADQEQKALELIRLLNSQLALVSKRAPLQ